MNLVQLLGSNLRSLRSRDLAPVEVAVLDTGIDATHPDLKDRVVGAYRIVRARGGHEAVPQAVPASNDAFGHGTGVASIIASVAPNARLVDIQVVGSGEVGTGEALMAGFRLALGLRAHILNLSLACHRRFLLPLVELCEEAYWKDRVVVAARRNLPLLDEGIPAELSSCLGVDAGAFPSSLSLGFRARSPIEYVARGEQIVVAAPGGKYTVQTGSSYASATLAGICALVLGGCPDLSPFEVKAALKAMAEGPPP